MSEIFISHRSTDSEAAGEIRGLLEASGFRSIFLDCHPEDGIAPGEEWEQRLYAQLAACKVMVLLCSKESMTSHWCLSEFAVAQILDRIVIGVLLDGSRPSGVFSRLQMIKWRQLTDPAATLTRALKRNGVDPVEDADWDRERSPYPGLRSFEEEDEAVFFGRDSEIRQSIQTLEQLKQSESNRTLLVLGPSGSGKSSVARAGVVPRLRSSDEWSLVGPVIPGSTPERALRKAMVRAFRHHGLSAPEPNRVSDLDRAADDPIEAAAMLLVRQAQTLTEQLAGERSSVLLVIDQFEELLAGERAARTDEPAAEALAERDRFLRSVRRALTLGRGELLLMATLRSDFFGLFQQHPLLREMEKKIVPVDTMSAERLRQVIEGPARVAGLTLEPTVAGKQGLIDRLLADTGTPDALPLLAFTLEKLWRHGHRDRRLTCAEYDEIGSIQTAVADTADRIVGDVALSAAEEQELRTAFLAMVRLEAGDRWVRRPTSVGLGRFPATVRAVLEEMARQRLLSLGGGERGATIRITHEALLRNWRKLGDWLDSSREFLLWRNGLQARFDGWRTSGFNDGSLLRTVDLDRALEWLAESGEALSPDERRYIEQSAELRRRESAEERRRLREDQRNLSLMLVEKAESIERDGDLAGAEIFFAAALTRHPDHPRSPLYEKHLDPQELARGQREWNRIRRGHYRVRNDSRYFHERSVGGVAEAPPALKVDQFVRTLLGGAGAGGPWITPDGRLVEYLRPSVGTSRPGNRLVRWDWETGEPEPLEGEFGHISASDVDLAGGRLATLDAAGRLSLSCLASGRLLARVELPRPEPDPEQPEAWQPWQVSLVLLPAENLLILADADDAVVRRLPGLEIVEDAVFPLRHPLVHGGGICVGRWAGEMSEAPNLAGSDPGLGVWASHLEEPTSLLNCLPMTEGSQGRAFAVSPDGRRVAVVVEDKKVQLIDLEKLEGEILSFPRPQKLIGHEAGVRDLRISPDSEYLVSCDDGLRCRLWRLADNHPIAAFAGKLPPAGLAFAPGGAELIVGDGCGRVVRCPDGETIARLPSDGRILSFSPDGRRVLTSQAAGMAIWKVRPPTPLVDFEAGGDAVARIAISRGEPRTLATLSGEGSGRVQFFSAATGDRLADVAEVGVAEAIGYSTGGERLLIALEGRLVVARPNGAIEWQLVPPGGADGSLAGLPGARELAASWPLAAAAAEDVAGLLATCGPDGLSLHRLSDLSPIELPERDRTFHAVEFSPDGSLLAAAGDAQGDQFVRVWALDPPRLVHEWLHVERAVEALAFSPDATRLAVAWPPVLEIFDVASGRRKRVGHQEPVFANSLGFSPDGWALASASGSYLQYWEVASGLEAGRRRLAEEPDSVSFDPSLRIAYLALGGRVRGLPIECELLRGEPSHYLEEAQRRAGRELRGTTLVPLDPGDGG